MADLRQRYADKIDGVISCFDGEKPLAISG
jgi:hypothetical protein